MDTHNSNIWMLTLNVENVFRYWRIVPDTNS